MRRSEQCDAISKALAAAQAEMKNPAFDSSNPHFRNKFASLAAIRNAVVPVFSKHGLSVMQELSTTDNGVACLTVVQHESGQWFEFGPLVMPATKPDAQGYGSAGTYCRRYALQSVVAIVGDEDDDGNEAAKPTQKAAKATAKNHAAIQDALDKVPELASVEAVTAFYKSLPPEIRGEVVDALTRRKKELIEAQA
jgi:hypothetical protein